MSVREISGSGADKPGPPGNSDSPLQRFRALGNKTWQSLTINLQEVRSVFAGGSYSLENLHPRATERTPEVPDVQRGLWLVGVHRGEANQSLTAVKPQCCW